MELIEQSYRIDGLCPTNVPDNLRRAELYGRICYQSQDKATDDSWLSFCQKAIDMGHWTVVEHTNLVVRAPATYESKEELVKYFFGAKYLDFKFGGEGEPGMHGYHYIGGSYRAWMEYFNFTSVAAVESAVRRRLQRFGDDIFEIVCDQSIIPRELQRVSVKIVTDRAVTHELVRHRPCVFLQLSQRYVDPDNIKFIVQPEVGYPNGENENTQDAYDLVINMCDRVETAYRALRVVYKRSPQVARYVLPNCAQTEIACTANLPEWDHIFKLRTSAAAFPPMRRLMIGIQEEFADRGWV